MGVTIHFEGQLPDDDKYAALLEEISAVAVPHGWPIREINEVEMALNRIVDEQSVDYLGPVTGIELLPHPRADPLRFEFDRHLFMQQYCKTQFAGVEAHIEVIELLRRVGPLFVKFDVFDEGQYWETGDRSILQGNLDTVKAMIAKAMHEDPTARGPLRLPSGRVVDFVSDPE